MNGPRDFAERILRLATRALPPRRREWAQAMRSEAAALKSPVERRLFALSAARAALRERVRLRLVPACAASLAIAAIAHLLIWLPWQLIGAALGVAGRRQLVVT